MTWRVAFLTALTLCAAAAPGERFFPARPSGAVPSMQEGVLVRCSFLGLRREQQWVAQSSARIRRVRCLGFRYILRID
jgi:hypothetical protein